MHDRRYFDVDKFKLEMLEDDRFVKLKMYVMHDGVNPNKSSFSLDVIKAAEDSIINIPILAHIEEADKDFGEHDMEWDEDKEEIIYIEKPIGVVPAVKNNYHYEEVDGRTYVVVDSYIWSVYAKDAVEIITRDKDVKLSMEVVIDSSKYDKKTKILKVEKYRYTGITLLGKKYGTGMKNTHAQLEKFSMTDFTEKANELNKFLLTFGSDETHISEGENFAENNIKEDGAVKKSYAEIAAQFGLTASQLGSELNRLTCELKYEYTDWSGEKRQTSKYYVKDFDESHIFVADREMGYMDYKIPYSMNGDNPVLDFASASRIKYVAMDWDGGEEDGLEMESLYSQLTEEFKSEFTAKTEMLESKISEKEDAVILMNTEMSALQEKFSALESEVEGKNAEIASLTEEVQAFKLAEEEEKVEALFAGFADVLSAEDKATLKEKRESFAMFSEFEKEVKSFVCDKVVSKAKVVKDAKFISMAVVDEKQEEEKKEKSLWDRLKN